MHTEQLASSQSIFCTAGSVFFRLASFIAFQRYDGMGYGVALRRRATCLLALAVLAIFLGNLSKKPSLIDHLKKV
jgi:hypothetical protein